MCPRAFDYDAEQFNCGSEMPKRPDVGAIADQVTARLKQIEDQVNQNQRIADELARLRDAVKHLERAIPSRSGGEPVPAAIQPRQPHANALPSGHERPSGHPLQRAAALPDARPHHAAKTRRRFSQR
jgi:hypothetical protein